MVRKQKAFFFPDDFSAELKNDTGKALTRAKRGARKASSTKAKVYNCETCKLYQSCQSPKIKRFGKGEKGILIISTAPSRIDDRDGVTFMGNDGDLLRSSLRQLGISLDRDCVRTSVVGCFPGMKNAYMEKEPTETQMKACRGRLLEDIRIVNPQLIICLGTPAIKSVLRPQHLKKVKFNTQLMHGQVLPYHEYGCWVGGAHKPSFYLAREKDQYSPADKNLFLYDLARCVAKLGKKLPKPLDREGCELITDPDEAIAYMEALINNGDPFSFDFETNELHAHLDGTDIYCVSFSTDPAHGVMIPLSLIDENGNPYFNDVELSYVCRTLGQLLASDVPKIVQNLNMEDSWSRRFFDTPVVNCIHDTMIGAHVMYCNSKSTGLGFQAFQMRGDDYKEILDVVHFPDASLKDQVTYSVLDSRYTFLAYKRQRRFFERHETLGAFFHGFMMRGAKALASYKHRGVRIDLDELAAFEKKYKEEQDRCLADVYGDPKVKAYEVEQEKTFNVDSPAQVGKVIYDGYKIESTKMTKGKNPSTDEATLVEIQKSTKNASVRRLLSNVLRFRKTCSALERVEGYRKVMGADGYIHPNYNLNRAATYRSSASDTNVQNVFKHDPELKKFRRCIKPSEGRVFLEGDQGSLEVRIIAMASNDRELIRQLKEGVDMHMKWAIRLFQKPKSEIDRDTERFWAKNLFVFPSFFGSTADSIAKNMAPLGVTKEHVFKVQAEFWEEFAGVKKWQAENREHYLLNGYLEGVTGFRSHGPLSYNQLVNYPIQGPAFHLVLNGIIRIEEDLVAKMFVDEGIRSLPIIEVHDSVTFDAIPNEITRIVPMVDSIMTHHYFEWQRDVPMVFEWEVGRNWYDMHGLAIRVCGDCGNETAHSDQKVKEEDKKFHIYDCMECGFVEKVEILPEA
jgi:DNA polymerase-1